MSNIPISAMVFTLDEDIHLPACLGSLSWCDDVIVVDSFSSDKTEAIARKYCARFLQHSFEGFGSQRNWALEQADPEYDWVLILDADERVPPELADEMGRVVREAPEGIGAYRVRRRFYMWGRWLCYSNLYPTWVVRLIHKNKVRYINRGHAETQEVKGSIGDLQYDLIDENIKGIDEWFERQNRYSREEAVYEVEMAGHPLNLHELFSGSSMVRRAALKRLALRMPARPLLYFTYSYIWRRGFLDGKDGLVFCLMKAQYHRMIMIKKYDLRRSGGDA